MKVIIIEDEKPAAEKLQKAILQAGKNITVETVLGSVQAATNWLQHNQSPDLIFMDIELTDGLSFKIFESVAITCPVIFTTAFDEYWQEAFEHNSIDYLLKPIKQEKLEAALYKFEKLKQFFTVNFQQLQQWRQQEDQHAYKKRFLVKRGMDYITVRTEEVAYFYATHKLVCMVDSKGQKFILDKSLADLEKETDPAQFYRLNRKFLVNIQAIKKIKAWPKSKLLIEVDPPINEEIIVSQENVGAFKDWVGN
ncbi:MAG TPA: LytTR family DNA-binding domain-containing protein [Chitinophagaceae bacterium]|nr:LytTR family DNA-binding domain-containing protein [Chitinophagaceae bacterium]